MKLEIIKRYSHSWQQTKLYVSREREDKYYHAADCDHEQIDSITMVGLFNVSDLAFRVNYKAIQDKINTIEASTVKVLFDVLASEVSNRKTEKLTKPNDTLYCLVIYYCSQSSAVEMMATNNPRVFAYHSRKDAERAVNEIRCAAILGC